LKSQAISCNKLNGIFMFITHQSDPAKRARLRWRSRRGLLENDLILTRFLDAQETTLTDDEVDAFTRWPIASPDIDKLLSIALQLHACWSFRTTH